ncbi:MAG: hypothetical protein IIV14_09615 [Bacteroidaceae bacterium]|nr:hypothetical protein [Bacteroidaceae bacterium]
MSGSPIVQDGKLIGAVDHVLVNDTPGGFGTNPHCRQAIASTLSAVASLGRWLPALLHQGSRRPLWGSLL